ncbi:MAG: hypothetical protein HY690_21115 [Chloroflexi bacterium]|nr:hypothetical protein [Chloroflexota bacterium]
MRVHAGIITVASLVAFALSACAPAAAPSPTAAPAKPAAQPTAAPPTAVPAKPPEAKPEARPAATAAAVAKPTVQPAARVGFNEAAVADFYKSKTVRLITGGPPGGGYDTYSRAIARHMGDHIPGKPNMIVENMAGAGMVLAANHVYNVAPKDGTVLINYNAAGIALQQLLGTQGVEVDASKFQYLGVPTGDTSLCIASKASGFKSLAETMGPNGKQFIVGGNGPGNALDDDPAVLAAALGANIKVISGYKGTPDIRLAMDGGEVQGICGWSWESFKISALDAVKSGDYLIIAQNTEKPHKELPNVPVAYDLARTDEARQLFHYGIPLISGVQRHYAAPPGVPADRLQALREAFTKTLADKEFLADAEKTKLDIALVSGDEAQKLITELLAMPADIKARLRTVWKR